MKGYQSFKMDPAVSFEEFVELMDERWDKENNGAYEIGRPNSVAIGKELFVLLPATNIHIIIVRPRKNKMTLTVTVNGDGAGKVLTGAAVKTLFGPAGSLAFGNSVEKDRKGPAEQALLFYTEKLKQTFADYL